MIVFPFKRFLGMHLHAVLQMNVKKYELSLPALVNLPGSSSGRPCHMVGALHRQLLILPIYRLVLAADSAQMSKAVVPVHE